VAEPEVSVVLPTHDRNHFLVQALTSVLWQVGPELEVIVVDDGSTSDPRGLVSTFEDDRVRVIQHRSSRGVSAARNTGAAAAVGSWLAFIDDDDLWAPGKLAAQLGAARTTGRSWICTSAVRVDIDLNVVSVYPARRPEKLVRQLRHWNYVPGGCSGVLVQRRSLPDNEPIFDTRLKHFEDWDLWIRLAEREPPAVVARPLVGYRLHPQNHSLEMDGMIEDLRIIEQRHATTVDWGAVHVYLGWLHYRAGRTKRALRHWASAASQGQAPAVASILYSIGEGSVSKLFPSRGRRRSRKNDWAREADMWLRPLRERALLPDEEPAEQRGPASQL
jgi:glycosyltransferase involved in cell wall biosynthesis